jgi:hypothetical protein
VRRGVVVIPVKMRRCRVFAAAVFICMTGCSGGSGDTEPPDRAYQVPDVVCGIEVNAEDFAPLFPAGESLREEGGIAETEDGRHLIPVGACLVFVDDEVIFTVTVEVIETGGGFGDVMEELLWGDVEIDDAQSVENSQYETRVWADRALTFFDCAESRVGYTGFGVGIFTGEEGEFENSETLKRVMEPYAQAVMSRMRPESCRTD